MRSPILTLFCAVMTAAFAQAVEARQDDLSRLPTLQDAQRLFYNGKYEAAAAAALQLGDSPDDALAAGELRTAALHFQLRRAMGQSSGKDAAFSACGACPALLSGFIRTFNTGQGLARARLKANPEDVQGLFFLGKLDLNYVWLHVDTLGRRTGWKEFREARRSLDAALKVDPQHVRARVARSWIDYIIDTKVPGIFAWMLGGGNKKRGLAVAKEAASTETDYFSKTEAVFALWDMQVRERNFAGAVVTARQLAIDFPENPELTKFLEAHAPAPTR